MSSKSDRRSIRTKKELKDNLITLLSTGRIIESISVKELADLADISRSTFYLHYSDIYDLLDDIENDFFDEFRSVFDGFHPEELTESPLPRIDCMRALRQKRQTGPFPGGQSDRYVFFPKDQEYRSRHLFRLLVTAVPCKRSHEIRIFLFVYIFRLYRPHPDMAERRHKGIPPIHVGSSGNVHNGWGKCIEIIAGHDLKAPVLM